MSVLEKLTEGIVERSLRREGAALLEKWESTGLLEGLNNDQQKQGMALMLENQAAQLLKEASSMAAGDVEGFASVAFPIVRRVFGGLLANDLVSVQPMSLPSGLIFFLDFTYESGRMGADGGQSIYGGGVVGKNIVSGASDITEDGGGFYNLANAYSHATGSQILDASQNDANPNAMSADELSDAITAGTVLTSAGTAVSALSDAQKKAIRYDADILGGEQTDLVSLIVARLDDAESRVLNYDQLGSITLVNSPDQEAADSTQTVLGGGTIIRRLTERGFRNASGSAAVEAGTVDAGFISMYVVSPAGSTVAVAGTNAHLVFPLKDDFLASDAVGSLRGDANWPLEEPSPGTGNAGETTGKQTIAEIDIKVDSIAVTAMTKKLKAKWSPELGQDLNAYHNLDAEVELTQILSEQIALEIDREILNDLVQGAKAGTYYWSRSPGLFVNRQTGAELGAASAAPDFTGTVSEWYETLIETINDVSAQIHRKTLRGGANFLVTSPEVANILEFTAGFRANVTHDADKGTVGAVNVGSLSRKFDVHVDPYFPRNLVLVGRKGGSFLESGYVYAPYVPLQVTPTIFGTEDFVPRKGVMTRYAKKMVRPDMYGLVVCRGLLGEEGGS